MSSARAVREIEHAGFLIGAMTEHDLLEVVEIEETTGLSLWGWDAYRAELERPEALMLAARSPRPSPLAPSTCANTSPRPAGSIATSRRAGRAANDTACKVCTPTSGLFRVTASAFIV
ncbi:MAG TPA: hypothetical protein VD968_20105, partial [Pyrinomonadaceae bacterium]|nr:hypothetical protein [Pyrinomonadaceae bacterium]